jgi:thymidylate synthase
MTFTISNVDEDYIKLVNHVITEGNDVAPRGVPTREIQAFTLEHVDPHACVVSGIGRGANLAIAAAEALQLVGGCSEPELMKEIAPNFAQFMDGGAFYGAYGPRIQHQLPRVAKILKEDPNSRRAFVSIWRSDDLFVEGSVDYPCTIGFTFQIRNNHLDMHTHMRSNDVWWGFTYDITQFCFLQLTMAKMLHVGVGSYFHHADSFHIYERDIERARALVMGPNLERIYLDGIATPSWASAQRIARSVLKGEAPPRPESSLDLFHAWIEKKVTRKP